ncbi:anti-sigma factor [Nocardioides sp. YIM 152315]|uniref:anti-sigma factor n=1 Tax=Nocardioides sp. YIM 152315 TaxID=3031760 RepID=UPI0023DA23B8|nr:anti-sigma factor [Nocardioides sp. YIM 152315]MDF1604315.1 anti-sigma factor [Nocardioides sp. YIM 152315]
MTSPHEFHAMTGAYAVDALDELERAAFERHLADCPDCRAEVAGLRETAALLAETVATEPPAALRDRVLTGIGTVRPLPPEVRSTTRPPHRRLRLLAAAAAAVVLAGAGAAVWQQPWEDGTTQGPTVAQQVLDAPDAQSTSLDFQGGASATVTHSDSLDKAVIVTSKMPPPPEGKVYQLWLDQPGEGMVSAGLMPVERDQTVVLDGAAGTATAAGITVEPEGGSPEPTTDPIALFDFGRSG